MTRAPDVDELQSRAASGAALLGARGLLIYTFSLVANLVLARLLVPRDFGLVALGTVVVVLGTYLAEGGFGAALIRRAAVPTRSELRAVLGLQLALTTLLVVASAAVAVLVGRDGFVVATMVASLPIAVLRAPSVVVLERRLEYRTIAWADVAEALAYYVWAIGAVALGFGVWGLATAVVVRAVVGSATVLVLGPLGPVRPSWEWGQVRPLIGFGAKFQATTVLQLVREQGLNVGIAAVAGVATLGVWNLAWRVLQVPNLLFVTVARVAFPAVSRLLEAGGDPRPYIERGLASIAVLTGAAAAGVAGLAPALPVLVGDRWGDVPAALLWSSVAICLAAPLAVVAPGYLFAADEAGAVALATLVSALAWFGVAFALLPELGAPAAGIGWVVGGVLNSALLWRRTHARTGAAIGRRLAGPTAASLAAVAAGWGVAEALGGGALPGVAGAVAGELVLVLALAALSPAALRDARSLVRQALASFRS